ncbi:thioredoxin-disulfide reductase [Carnobacteriaceae bacterium zg-ZUI252]|nr:thioredoxin-disulfide reductase [Carnobacteriaceae bacterium zg-ZUI252]MBS4769819.1 thioredoxin-disulfide reductase [Carnobacteriaceae bacterium zg-ZUI240]QTU82666.1 thioredoxin-disulfide reductase [Carnobacteriaceae bacterium zg-C25]
MEKIYDVIVVGSGPAGMTAALYASRANLSVLILERGMPGGELLNTSEIENYPGYPLIAGPDLAQKMNDSALSFGAESAYGNVSNIAIEGDVKVVTVGKKTYRAYSLIIATGAHHRKLGVPGEEEFSGRGVSYCAVCDGAFFKNRHLIVVGGGDSAVEEGAYLTQYASKVTIVHRRDALRAQKILQDRAFKNPKIEFIWNNTVEEVVGEDGVVTGVQLVNTQTGEKSFVQADGVFIYVGVLPNSEPFKQLGLEEQDGWIVTDNDMATNVPGVFAVGDVRFKTLRQVVTAVGDGGQAGQAAYHYVETLKERLSE